ncbi:MAG: hypothetical protein WDW38_005917 [Sanguina aurantia]
MAGPPPPYDSIIASDGPNQFFGSGFPPSQEFEIVVSDPIKQGEGVGAHVTYKVKTRTSQPRFSRPSVEVSRRFRHFSALSEKLAERHRGVILPALPEKSTVQKFHMSAEFIESRRRALQTFLAKVACHPILKDSKELQLFLEANDEEWMLEIARWQGESSVAKAPVTGAVAWLKGLQHSATNLMAGRRDDALEDAEYIKVRDYINHLESHLNEAHRQAARLVRKESELGLALSEFGAAAEALGKHDSSGGMRGPFDALFVRSNAVAALSRGRCEEMSSRFEAPLKEFARSVKSVQAVMGDRAAALADWAQAKGELDSKKVRHAKLRATPGAKEESVSAAERDVGEGETRVKNTRIGYDTIVSRMSEELSRFQRERSADMSSVLKEFALAQAQLASEQAQAWSGFLADVQATQAHTATMPTGMQ